MSEHRRKAPQSQEGGRAAARRGQSGPSSGHRAAPRGATGSAAGSTESDSYGPGGDQRPYGGRAEARRAAQKGGRRRGADPTGPGGRSGPGGPNGPGRGRAAAGPGRKRIIDYPRHGKYGWRRWVPSWRLTSGMFIGFLGSLVAVAGIGYATVNVPDVAKTASAQNNVFYWSDNTPMVATGGEVNRQIVNYEQIPKEMRYAVISQENKSFETDSGVDPMGIARAMFNMARGGQVQGGSTITQQYVKNAMLDDQAQTLSRKFTEIFVSIKVGATKSKPEIMAGYLNSAYFGRGAYGIQAAARAYFNTDADKLDPGQCAFLAAMLKGATYYDPAGAESLDPIATPEANRRRADIQMQDTLDKMVQYGHLDQAERAKYTSLPKVQNPRSNSRLSGQVGYLVDLAKSYLVHNSDTTKITADRLQQGGLRIYTTFDKKKVGQLENAVKNVRKKNIDASARPDKDSYVQFGGASVEPKTGAIKAIYGGEDATKHFTDNADATGAQVGSTFKPFVLAAAMKWGVRNPDLSPEQAQDERTPASWKSLYSGQNKLKIQKYDGTVWTDKDNKEWLQTNDGNESVGTAPDYKIDLREAMRLSVNSVYVQLGMDVGLDKVEQTAIDAGILKSSLASSNFPSFSIGTSDPSAIRMAGAYGTFATSGTQNDPYSVEKVDDATGPVFRHQAAGKDVFKPEVADNVTDVLKTVVDKGTGTAARLPGRQVAGKTGTTDGNKSAWFVGYTRQLSTAISMFRLDDNAKNKNRKFLKMFGTGGQEKIHGASFPAEIWHDYMAEAMRGQPALPFPAPAPIGKALNVPTAPPTPTAPPSQSTTPTPTPTPSQTTTSPTPTVSQSCQFGWGGLDCGEDGGTGNADGGANGGPGAPPTPSTTETTEPGANRGNGNGGNGNGGNGGGIFSGAQG
ncbi:penicillin-binding protein [Streptomyces sp. J2-1]|uniref:transglycosylase domain-containing protein n=1 Tax=Streptomyces corallincola TaxID=2851888 RepID=UPI001C383DDC|nr:transglycosylase domain-containing protein [Streptomyces corallincola]MBV2354825.1 penicillin-binding protein [Streptomyces corallincola]